MKMSEEEAPNGRNCCLISASPGRSSKARVCLLFCILLVCFYGQTSIIYSILMMMVIRQRACGHDLGVYETVEKWDEEPRVEGKKSQGKKKKKKRSEEVD